MAEQTETKTTSDHKEQGCQTEFYKRMQRKSHCRSLCSYHRVCSGFTVGISTGYREPCSYFATIHELREAMP